MRKRELKYSISGCQICLPLMERTAAHATHYIQDRSIRAASAKGDAITLGSVPWYWNWKCLVGSALFVHLSWIALLQVGSGSAATYCIFVRHVELPRQLFWYDSLTLVVLEFPLLMVPVTDALHYSSSMLHPIKLVPLNFPEEVQSRWYSVLHWHTDFSCMQIQNPWWKSL